MSQTVEALRHQALDGLHKTTTSDELAQWRSRYLGRKGAVGALFGTIGKLPAEERARFWPTSQRPAVRTPEGFRGT